MAKEENYYEIDNEKMHLDKDILFKNNKIYSPNTCCICPARINTLFTTRKNDRNKNGIIGVGEDKHTIKGKVYIYYRSRVNINNKNINCAFDTIEDAFMDYKNKKEQEIKRIADLYKNKIPKKLYDAMYNYQVEITD